MTAAKVTTRESARTTGQFLYDLSRAYGGALIFSFPMMMTMEMWWLGFHLEGVRLTIFTCLSIPLLTGLSFYEGFEDTFTTGDDIRETFIAYAVGFTTAAVVLFLFGEIRPGNMSVDEIIGKIAIQAVGASLGAMFAQNLLGGDEKEQSHTEQRKRSATYSGQLFLMVVGALFLSMSVSPTEEMTLISFKMTYWHSIALALFTLLIMHAFVHAIEQREQQKGVSLRSPFWGIFLRFTVVGYAIVLVISFYILWTFGSIDGMALPEKIKSTIVLGFPAALGASASRWIL